MWNTPKRNQTCNGSRTAATMGAQWLRYQNDPATTQPLYRLCPTQPIVKTAGFFYARTTKINNVKFAHQSVCNSPIALLMKAINAGFLHGAPNLDAHTVQKYLLASPATSKGHMKRPRKGIRSKTPKHAITAPNIYHLLTPQRVNGVTMPGLEYNDEEDVLPIPPLHNLVSEIEDESIAKVFCFGAFTNKVSGIVYNNCTGDFPYMSLNGNVCFFVMYHYETNAILITPIAGLDSEQILEAYKKNFEYLVSKGFKPKINVMDNQATKQPSNQATKQPSNQSTKQPSNQATKQPSQSRRISPCSR